MRLPNLGMRMAGPPFLRGGILYLLRDEFTTAQAAPLTSPRTCEPGPGTLTIVDTGNKVSITGGALDYSGGTTDWTDPRFYSGGFTRTAGLAYFGKMYFVSGQAAIMAASDNPPTMRAHAIIGGTGVGIFDGGALSVVSTPTSFTASTWTPCAIILRASGAFYCGKVGASWILIHVGTVNSQATMYFGAGNYAKRAQKLDSLKVVNLGSPWNTAYGLATGYTASPTSGATLTHEANCNIGFDWTVGAGETLEIDLRRTDADNRWIVRCSQSGSTIKLIQREAGSETERSSAAQTWTAGTKYHICILAEGAKIGTSAADATQAQINKNGYTSASFNQTATGAMVSGFTTGANFATWPRTLSGAALAALEAV